jgi:1-acyl-sn-glycerol-3-phosphate acyltransferase
VTAKGPFQSSFYFLCKYLLRGSLATYVRVRYFNVPDESVMRRGLLVVSNHQSFLDPVLVGMALPAAASYLARRDLFRIPVFGQLIAALNAQPVSRGAVDSKALRNILRLLRSGETVLMFPEGTRSHDGALGRFKPGAAAIAIRCGVAVLPACVEGAYECWPRRRTLPRPGRVAVAYGRPLQPRAESAEELTERVRAEIEGLQRFLRRYLGRTED